MRRFFDTDQHLTAPRGFFDPHWPAKYRDVMPRVIDQPDGTQAWAFDGGAVLARFGLDNAGGDNPNSLKNALRYDELDPSFYDPKARVEAMDRDGVQAMLLFSSGGGAAAGTREDGLYRETFRAYNDAVLEWAQQGDPARILPAAMIPCRDLEMSMVE
ncbi:MAG: hypothetical protein KGJ86_10060, partial [Chloroflexota bacterium]|nr:hypothetical protein [Chloroflexota bacterium]